MGKALHPPSSETLQGALAAGRAPERAGKMRILWFPRLQADIDRFHRVTWRKMAEALQGEGHSVRVAVAGLQGEESGSIPLPLWAFRGGRLLSSWILGRIAFSRELSRFRPDVVILDPFSFWFAFPTLLFRNRPLFVLDHRTPLDHDSRKGRGGAKLLARFLERISGWLELHLMLIPGSIRP